MARTIARTTATARMNREMKTTPPADRRLPPEVPGRCNAPLPPANPDHPPSRRCRMAAGRGTDHPRSGPCRDHDPRYTGMVPGRASPAAAMTPWSVTQTRYAQKLTSEDLRQRLTSTVGAEQRILDLEPELHLLRTLLLDTVNNFEALRAGIIAWYVDGGAKPRAVPDLRLVMDLLERIGRMVERIAGLQAKSSIDVATFRRVVEAMGIVVARHVADVKALQAIEAEWSAVTVNPGASKALPDMVTRPYQVVAPDVDPTDLIADDDPGADDADADDADDPGDPGDPIG